MPIPTIKLLQRVLDYSTLKQKTISENIANISTVNYKRKDVPFSEVLNQNRELQLKETKKTHISNINRDENGQPEFRIVNGKDGLNTNGKNNIDIDQEMADMAKNQIMFRFAARKLNIYYQTLQEIIRGGR